MAEDMHTVVDDNLEVTTEADKGKAGSQAGSEAGKGKSCGSWQKGWGGGYWPQRPSYKGTGKGKPFGQHTMQCWGCHGYGHKMANCPGAKGRYHWTPKGGQHAGSSASTHEGGSESYWTSQSRALSWKGGSGKSHYSSASSAASHMEGAGQEGKRKAEVRRPCHSNICF